MVANNVNHAKWATGETRSCFSLEFEEWTHWVKAILWDESKTFLSLSFGISLSLCFCKKYMLHAQSPFLTCFTHLSLCPYAPYIRETKMEWVMVSESRLSFINGFKQSGVSGWWIVRHIMAVLHTHESFILTCDVLFVLTENVRV